MPSTDTITAFYVFAQATVIKSAYVNNNFANFRGHIIPIDPSLGALATGLTYDLGSAAHSWRGVFNQYGVMYGNTSGSIPSNPAAGSYAFYFKSNGKAYKKDSTGLENELGGGALVVTGTRASPSTITAAGGITFVAANGARQLWYVMGDTTSTATDITANPQISAGTDVGQELIIVGRDDAKAVIFDDGTGLDLNGQWTAESSKALGLYWDGTNWAEMFRR